MKLLRRYVNILQEKDCWVCKRGNVGVIGIERYKVEVTRDRKRSMIIVKEKLHEKGRREEKGEKCSMEGLGSASKTIFPIF